MKFILYIVGFLNTSIVLGQQHQNGNMYLLYDVPSNKHYNIDQEIIPKTIAPGTFWALTFGFNEINEGGYIGIQTDYSSVNKGLFIFSIWNAVGAEKGDKESFIEDFGGEGVGKSCRISIPLIVSHIYRLRVWQLDSDITGTYYGAWILDKSINKEYYLGKIKTNEQSTLSNRVSNFVEYYGEKKPCNKVPFSRALFYPIKFDCDDNSGVCKYIFMSNRYTYADCVNGKCILNDSYSNVSFGGE
jgi:Domain of unknown function (DUF3472)